MFLSSTRSDIVAPVKSNLGYCPTEEGSTVCDEEDFAVRIAAEGGRTGDGRAGGAGGILEEGREVERGEGGLVGIEVGGCGVEGG